jgi:hypothetical protein
MRPLFRATKPSPALSADYSLAVLALATVLVIREKTGASAQTASDRLFLRRLSLPAMVQ